jgi:ATP-dependent exoDNAse (exonuclease V) alpha subunit
MTRNNAELDLANGQRLKVLAVRAEQVTLTDGSRQMHLPTDRPLHLDHAHATTVHSAQGLTSDKVLIDANSRSLTMATDVYYVAISRARYEAQIYTDDLAKLPAAISKDHVKHAALDLKPDHRAHARELPRLHGAYSHDRQLVTPPTSGLAHERSGPELGD